MQEIREDEIKRICLSLLKEFDKICRDNQLKYSIGYGTLLGAVRHGGFIPWDDDIDVVMPRTDYEKLLMLDYKSEKYEILSYKRKKGYYYPYVKMCDKRTKLIEKYRREKCLGVFIDIFPIDFDIDSKSIEKKVYRSKLFKPLLNAIAASTDLNGYRNVINGVLYNIARIILSPFSRIILNINEATCYGIDGKYGGQLVYSIYNVKDVFPNTIWHHISDIQFEGISVMCFTEYDKYLKQLYGDYMVLPPKDCRASNHSFRAYWK